MKRKFLKIIVLLLVCMGLTSCFCTPQDVDSFAEGFKEGYFGDDYDEK